MKTRRLLIFWTLLILINLCIAEIVLSVYFFRKNSDYPLAITQAFDSAKRRIFHSKLPRGPVGIWKNDPELGYTHIANSSGTDKCQDNKVSYTIGAEGERYIPIPENPLGRILFLGCSITFGQGVNDDQTYSYLLSNHWKQWQVVNKAVMGWGTSHAYLTLKKELDSNHPPSMVIYGFIQHHIQRNYLRRIWIDGLSQSGRKHPHFELENRNLVFKGAIDNTNDAVKQNEDSIFYDKELELTKAFLLEMQKISRQKSIPFIILILNPIPHSIMDLLIEHEIMFLDLSDIKHKNHPCYKHPTPNTHKKIAGSILTSFIPGILENISKDIYTK